MQNLYIAWPHQHALHCLAIETVAERVLAYHRRQDCFEEPEE